MIRSPQRSLHRNETMSQPPTPEQAAKFQRQLKLVTTLGVVLIVTGIVVLAALSRLPPPLRIMAGLGDIFVGSVLLVLVRQARL